VKEKIWENREGECGWKKKRRKGGRMGRYKVDEERERGMRNGEGGGRVD